MDKQRILVVDDDDAILEVMQFMLEDAGYEVEVCGDGGFIDDLENGNSPIPALILLDVLISGYDGRELARILKASDKTKHIPIIMLSAHPLDRETIRETGAADFIAKPFDVDVLLGKITEYIK